jgi:cytochrome bd-type quinol oxidase subunit 2
MRFLGFIFVSLLFSTAVVGADYLMPGSYLKTFLDDHFIETFATIVGFNIAAVVFLMGQLMVLEDKYATTFERTRREIKHNTYFLISAFAIVLLVLVFRPDFIEDAGFKLNAVYYAANVAVIAIFSLAIFAIYEILHAVFVLGKNDIKK